jgi:hypothetical protein
LLDQRQRLSSLRLALNVSIGDLALFPWSPIAARGNAKNSLPVDADRRRRAFIGTAFGGFIEMELLVRSDEWHSLKEQFALLVRTEGARTDEVEELLDVQFQRRVAELIEQAAGPDHSHRLR